jgi:hypothetical protein
MAETDARQTAIRGSGGHFNNPKSWLFWQSEIILSVLWWRGYSGDLLAVLSFEFCAWQSFFIG